MAAYYTTAKMVDLIELYVNKFNDEQKEVLNATRPLITALLNRGQLEVVGLMDRRNVDILDAKQTVTVDGSGAYALGSLTSAAYNGAESVDEVFIVAGKYCIFKDFDEYKDMVNADYTFSANEPVCYFRGESVYVEPYVASTTQLTIYYMKTPTTHVDGSGTPTAFSQPVLEIIIVYTAHLLFDYLQNPTLSDKVLNKAYSLMNVMNEKQIVIGEKEAGLD
ncbi:hypothetical protein LCGC14_0711520 [marine sediment metagenome]|uniref:Uncharacterized protein n=1 Tax=marine sediment metagenome TaxID=412755 RepID=A0A0F9R0B4_9ZZZZ